MAFHDISLLKTLPLFYNLTEPELVQVSQALESRPYAAGQQIIQLGQTGTEVQIVLSGSVKVFIRRPMGAQMTVAILGRGEVLGELSALDAQPHSAGVMAIEPTCCLVCETNAFTALAQKMPTLSFNLLITVVRRLRRLTGHAEALATLDVAGRVAHQLLYLSHEHGCPCPEGILIPLRLTQSDLAGLCGASREKVNRVLQNLRKRRYIALDGDQFILVVNRDALSKFC